MLDLLVNNKNTHTPAEQLDSYIATSEIDDIQNRDFVEK